MKMRSFFEDWGFPAARTDRSLHPGYGTTGRQSSVRLNRVTAISIATSIRPASASVS